MSTPRQTRALAQVIGRGGEYCCERTGKGHWMIRTAAGKRVITFASSPSDRRWYRAMLADLRRYDHPNLADRLEKEFKP